MPEEADRVEVAGTPTAGVAPADAAPGGVTGLADAAPGGGGGLVDPGTGLADAVSGGGAGVAPAPDGPPLLASRLAAPAPPGPLLLRPRLVELLETGAGGPVTLVAAPAGWGKTTLLAGWARATRAVPSPAWVSVEGGDTGERLWSYLAAALRGAVTGAPEPDGPPVPDALPRPDQLELLAAALATRDRPVLLVLDDLHRITDPAALSGLEFLLRHTEGRLRLVVGARTEPPLALHRWRLAGELTEIGPAELAFTDDEVADLLVAHGVPLPAAVVPRLRERTGGWPAGLRFAALALRGAADPAWAVERFGGDQPDVAAYLRDEVLAPLDPDARDVLRRAAVAAAVCADLAAAVTGRAEAGQVLADLARSGGFVQHDGGAPPWYRCHPLLTEVLRDEVGRLSADELRDLHLRAAGWYAANGRPAEALRHALTGGDWDRATDLLIRRWPELVPYDGDDRAGPPPAAPPEAAVRRDPELALACAAERAYAGDLAAAAGHLRRAAGHLGELPAPRRDRAGRLAAALDLTLARLAGDHAEVRRAATRLRATAPAPAGGPRPGTAGAADGARAGIGAAAGDPRVGAGEGIGDPRAAAGDEADVRAVVGAALGLVALAEGALTEAGERFAEALSAAREAGRPRTELVCASRSALLDAARGELRAAEGTAREALALPPGQGWSCQVDRGYAYLALALVAGERDDPAEAAAHLALAGPATAAPTGAALAALCRAELLVAAGEPAAALRTLVAAREAAPGVEPAAALTAAEAQVRAAVGDVDTARALLTDALRRPHPAPARPPAAPDGPGGRIAESGRGEGIAEVGLAGTVAAVLGVALARVELRAGDPRAAERALPDWAGPAAGSWPLPVRVRAGLLDAVLARDAGDERRAGLILEQVLDLAAPQGFRRDFTRPDPGVRDLLAAHLDSGTAHWATVSELVRGADERDADGPAERSATPARGLDEPLTERELTILRYLQSILSNVEIASELSLSVNTVKTHVRNIYRKLDATRRREAVRRARELRLI